MRVNAAHRRFAAPDGCSNSRCRSSIRGSSSLMWWPLRRVRTGAMQWVLAELRERRYAYSPLVCRDARVWSKGRAWRARGRRFRWPEGSNPSHGVWTNTCPVGNGFRALTGDGWRSSWTLHISDRKARKGKPGSVFTAEVLRLMVFSERWFDSTVPCCPPSTDIESKDLSVRNTN